MVRAVRRGRALPAAASAAGQHRDRLRREPALPRPRRLPGDGREVSVALHAGYRSQGVGSALYQALFDRLAGEPVHVAVAGIAMPNDASVALHRKFGFTEVGTFREYAVKNGRYISSLWMQRVAPSGGPAGRPDHQ